MNRNDDLLTMIGGIERLDNPSYDLIKNLNAQCYYDSSGSRFLKSVKAKFEVGLKLKALHQTLASNRTDYSAPLAVRIITQCKL